MCNEGNEQKEKSPTELISTLKHMDSELSDIKSEIKMCKKDDRNEQTTELLKKLVRILDKMCSELLGIKDEIKPKVLYKRPAFWISLLLVLIGIASAIIAWNSWKTTEDQYHASLREELRKLCVSMLTLRREGRKFSADIGNEMSMYLYRAITIQNEIPEEVTSSEYVIIADEIGRNGDYTLQKSLLKKAIDNSPKKTYVEVDAHRKLGKFYYNQVRSGPNPNESLKDANDCFEASFNVWNEDPDLFRSKYTSANTLLLQAYYEVRFAKKYMKAKECYEIGFGLLNEYPYVEEVRKAKDRAIKGFIDAMLGDIMSSKDINTAYKKLFGDEVNKEDTNIRMVIENLLQKYFRDKDKKSFKIQVDIEPILKEFFADKEVSEYYERLPED